MHKKVSYGGMAAALCILLLAMSGYLPSGKAATLFMASVTVYTVVFLTDKKTGVLAYGASALLAFVIIPSALTIPVSFAVCFGNYPVLKHIFDKFSVSMQIIFKFIAYTIYFSLVYCIFGFLLNISIPYVLWVLYLAGILVFAFYDWLLFKTGEYINFRFFKRKN